MVRRGLNQDPPVLVPSLLSPGAQCWREALRAPTAGWRGIETSLCLTLTFKAPSCGSATGRGRAPTPMFRGHRQRAASLCSALAGSEGQALGLQQFSRPCSSSHPLRTGASWAPVLMDTALTLAPRPGAGLSHFSVFVDPLGSAGLSWGLAPASRINSQRCCRRCGTCIRGPRHAAQS